MKFITPRRLVAAVATVLVLGVATLVVRPWLGGYAIRIALGMAGATGIRFNTVAVAPWRVVVEDLQFRLQSQDFIARRLTLDRPRWWRASLGKVQVEDAQVTVTIDGSDTNPWAWSTFDGEVDPAEPISLPVESLVMNGTVTVRAALQPDQPLVVKLEGAPKGKSDWVGSLLVDGPGFKLAAGGTMLGWGTELDFQVHSAELDLKIWQGFIQRNLLLPGGPWAFGGRLTGVGEGHVTARRFAATARVSLRDGWMRASTRDITAEGVEADLEFSDLWKFRTKSGQLRVKELRAGRLPLREVTAEFGLWGAQAITVNRAAFAALGGRAEVGPFRYFLNQREVAASLQVENLELEQVMKLATGSTVTVSGRVSGSLPLQIQSTGVRLDPGFLALVPGSAAELECNVSGLLRSGATISDESLAVLKVTGSKPLRLRLDELRLDIRQPDIPLGCSARVHLAGQTEDGPVGFDFNVNGSIESYLDVL
jgi:hypothetical protein